jgi:hypothetical protein
MPMNNSEGEILTIKEVADSLKGILVSLRRPR